MKSAFLSNLTSGERTDLIKKLWDTQNGKCFICEEEIDLKLHEDTSDIDHVLTNILSNEETENLQLSKNNFVFNYGTKKELDSYIQDYIHGNSLIFGNIRSSTSNRKESKLCYFCNKEIDSPVHQLLLCTEVAEVTQCNLLRNISSQNEFLKEILFSSSDELHKTFIERVQFLKGQHESVINDPED